MKGNAFKTFYVGFSISLHWFSQQLNSYKNKVSYRNVHIYWEIDATTTEKTITKYPINIQEASNSV